MDAIRHGFANINGASLYYEIAGAGPALVMLHGHLLDHRQWDDQFEVVGASHTVVRYDGRGMGQSSFPDAPYSHATDLGGLLDFLGLEHAALMGCSGGGSACVDFALQHPERVDGLILVDSGLDSYFAIDHGPPPPEVQAYFQAIQSGDVERALEGSLVLFTDGPRRKPEQVNAAVREKTRRMSAPLFSRRPPPGAVPQGLTPPAIERLGEIHAPTLVITGAEDAAMILDIANILVAGIPGARAVVIQDAGHHPNMEHPEQFNAIVAQFLSEITQH